ncbi:hypothetical protein E4T42_06703 [Aureobasidium subglaciale]|nr:hypothetical protein E4T42_06703 [Aureobasidium subglaciale]
MLSQSLISILALTGAVSASPALRRQAANAACPTALFDGCNPARSACPDGPGTFTTVSPSTYPTSYVINGQTVSLTAAPTSCLPTGTSSAAASTSTAAASGCVAKYNTCRTTRVNGLSANQAQCAADNAACQGACYTAYNTCRTTRTNGLSANQAQCASEYAGCLGENPFTEGYSTLPGAPASSTAAGTTAAPSTMTTSAAAAPKASSNAAAPGSNPKKVDGKTWTLQNVNRYCGETSGTCDYNFDIVANGATQHCTIVNANNKSFSNQKCANDNFTVSWGYVAEPAPAYAVITVVDKSNELAWFGVSNVDGQAVTASNPKGSGQYGNVGPEQVYTYN